MALTTAVSLTGDDLTLDDVWAVAVEGAAAALSEAPKAPSVTDSRAVQNMFPD